MPDFLTTLAMLGLSAGAAHPYGHMAAANALGVPGRVDYRNAVERYDRAPWDALSPEEQARVHAAGFAGQDIIARGMQGSSLERPMRTSNALYKLLYAAGVKPSGTEGDIELLSKTTGMSKGRINALLSASALFDVAGPDRQSLEMRLLDERTPGLVYTVPW